MAHNLKILSQAGVLRESTSKFKYSCQRIAQYGSLYIMANLSGKTKRRFLSVATGDEIYDIRNKYQYATSVRVMQWNILADALSYSTPTENFIKCSQEVLQWSVRGKRILDAILLYSPDLICLEEVDHFHDFFSPKLEKQGYSCHFVAKSDSPCLRVPGHTSPDGCAMFVKNDHLEFVKVLDISLQDDKGSVTNQVSILAVINILATNQQFLAGVCHLKAKPGNQLIRASQGKGLLCKVKEMASENDVSPIVLCGDFNAIPDETVYKEMRNGGLESSYFSATKSEAPFTTWKYRPSGEVRQTIDYIWHSPTIKLQNYLEIPSPDVIGSSALPSVDFPSDHLSLVFDYQFPC